MLARQQRLQYFHTMIKIEFLIPIALGVGVVFQSTINRQMAEPYGLATAVLINAVVFFAFSLFFFFFAKYSTDLVPEFFKPKLETFSFQSFYILPGIFGFALVFGLPWSIKSIGAAPAFILLVAAQIACSVLLDIFYFHNLVNQYKIFGAVLTLCGAVIYAIV